MAERLDGLARITLEELAITHFVKSGTLQNACSARPRVVVRFVKSAHMRIAWLTEQPSKRSKNGDKSAVAMLKKGNWQEREPVTDECHDRPGKPGKRSDKKLGQNSSKRQSSDARQLGYVFQDMTPPKSILRKSTDMPKPIQRVKFTKAIARHTKIRDQNPSLGYICPGEPHQRSPTLQNLRIGLRRLFLFDSTYSTLYFSAFLLSVPFFHLSDEQQPELYKKDMENLCDSANKGGEGTYDVLHLPTGYEPKGHDFDELQNSLVPPLLQDPWRGPGRG